MAGLNSASMAMNGSLQYLSAQAKALQAQYSNGVPNLSSQSSDDTFGSAVNVTLSAPAQAVVAGQNTSSTTALSDGSATPITIFSQGPHDFAFDYPPPPPILLTPLTSPNNPYLSSAQQGFLQSVATAVHFSTPLPTYTKGETQQQYDIQLNKWSKQLSQWEKAHPLPPAPPLPKQPSEVDPGNWTGS